MARMGLRLLGRRDLHLRNRHARDVQEDITRARKQADHQRKAVFQNEETHAELERDTQVGKRVAGDTHALALHRAHCPLPELVHRLRLCRALRLLCFYTTGVSKDVRL